MTIQNQNRPAVDVGGEAKPRKKKRRGLVVLGAVALVFVGAAACSGEDNDEAPTAAPSSTTATTDTPDVTDAPTVDNTAAPIEAVADVEEEEAPAAGEAEQSPADDVPREYRNALRSAQQYVDFSSFSYAKLYDQLTSEYGSGYAADAAQYAVDNIDVDWNAEALESAQSYVDFSGFSYAGLYDQLTSEYGEKFPAEQAQYAVDNVDVDWNAEAVESAESYLDFMPMSPTELYNQLVSPHGEEYTAEQAQHAVDTVYP